MMIFFFNQLSFSVKNRLWRSCYNTVSRCNFQVLVKNNTMTLRYACLTFEDPVFPIIFKKYYQFDLYFSVVKSENF